MMSCDFMVYNYTLPRTSSHQCINTHWAEAVIPGRALDLHQTRNLEIPGSMLRSIAPE
jgi:hypothetical protein